MTAMNDTAMRARIVEALKIPFAASIMTESIEEAVSERMKSAVGHNKHAGQWGDRKAAENGRDNGRRLEISDDDIFEAMGDGSTAQNIADEIGGSRNTISSRLRDMADRGLATASQEGSRIVWRKA